MRLMTFFQSLMTFKLPGHPSCKLQQGAQLPCSDNLHALRGPGRSEGGGQVRLQQLIFLRPPRRQQPGSKNCCGQQVHDRNARPHQRSCALLVFESGNGKVLWCGEVNRIDNTVAERKKCGEDVTWEGGQKDVNEDGPSRPSRHTRPGLHNGPPEKKTGCEETRVLGDMPSFRLQT